MKRVISMEGRCAAISIVNALYDRCLGISSQIICNHVNSLLEQWSYRNRCRLMTSGQFIPFIWYTFYTLSSITLGCQAGCMCYSVELHCVHISNIPDFIFYIEKRIIKLKNQTLATRQVQNRRDEINSMAKTGTKSLYRFHETFKSTQTCIHYSVFTQCIRVYFFYKSHEDIPVYVSVWSSVS